MASSDTTGTPERDFGRPYRLTASDLISDLLWPRLFRVPRLALRLDRILLAILLILLVGLVDQTLAAIADSEESPARPIIVLLGERFGAGLAMAAEPMAQLRVGEALMAVWGGAWGAVSQTFSEAPWRSSVVVPVALVLYMMLAVGIARMAVEDFARGRSVRWTEALAWSVQGLRASLVAHLIPVLVTALLVAILAAGGYALLGVPYLNILGAVFSVIGVLIAFIAVLLITGLLLGGPMLAPAIAAEGFDGVEAMQRIYSYVFTRPARLVFYGLVLALQFVVVSSVAVALAYGTSALAGWGMGLVFDWIGSPDGLAVASGQTNETMGRAGTTASAIVGTMLKLPGLVAAGFMVCYWISGWSVQYLLLRQSADGQDVTDIYVPGELEARVDRALAARAAVIEVDQVSVEVSESSDED